MSSDDRDRTVGVPGRVSVIVPTKNSAATIERCLSSIREQSHDDVELIVVDNHSTDATGELAGRLADRVIEAGPERSRQRNVGAHASSGEFLMFVDSDMILSPPVAAEAVQAFGADPDIQGLVIPERSIGQGFWARCRSLEKELYLGDPSLEAARVFRRPAFLAADGYDERLHAGEDWDLPERIAQAGGRIGRVQAGCLHDEGRLTLGANLRKKVYYGRSLGRYARKHPKGALRKVARATYVRNRQTLFRDPLVAAGLLFLKTTDVAGYIAGHLDRKRDRSSQDFPHRRRSWISRWAPSSIYGSHTAPFGRMRRTLSIVRSIPGSTILDVGCGDRWLTREFAAERRVFGIDLSLPLNDQATGRFAQADARHLPFRADSFDIVTVLESIEHIPADSEQSLLEECGRVLRGGGALLLTTPQHHPVGTYLDPAWWIQDHRHYEPSRILRLLRRAGFERTQLTCSGGLMQTLYLPLMYLFKRFGLEVPFEPWWRRAIDHEYERSGWYSIFVKASKPAKRKTLVRGDASQDRPKVG